MAPIRAPEAQKSDLVNSTENGTNLPSTTHGAAPAMEQSCEVAMMPLSPSMQQLPCPPGKVLQPIPPH